LRPDLAIVAARAPDIQRLAQRDGGQRILARNPPEPREGGVGQYHLTVRGKDGDRGVEQVQRGLPGFKLGAEIAGQVHFRADILEHEGQRAIGMRADRDAESLSRWQRPGLLELAAVAAALGFHQPPRPVGVVAWLRQHALAAHSVQEPFHSRARQQEFGLQPGQIGQRRVEELQPPVPVEDGKPDGQRGEGLGQRLDERPLGALGLVRGIGRQGENQLPLFVGLAPQIEPGLSARRQGQ
jgi:hypothetical protein